jgi:complete genome
MKKKKPEIRFNGFEGEWATTTLGECFLERVERSAEGELISVTISQGVVRASDLDRIDNSSNDKSNYKVVEVGDIAYNSMRMWQGACGYSLYKGICSPAYTVVIPQNNIDVVYCFYLFKRNETLQLFRVNSQGLTSDTWNLKYPAFSQIKCSIPSVSEQEKIGVFLTTLDKLIVKLEAKLDKLRKLKQALLEKMFANVNRGNETPEIRFKGYTDKWEVKELGEVFEMPTNRISGSELQADRYISTEHILQNFEGVEPSTSMPANLSAIRFFQNDILMANIRPYLKKIWLSDRNGGASSDVIVFHITVKSDPAFLYYELTNGQFIRYVMESIQGSKMPRGNKQAMQAFKMSIAPLSEQEQIGKCFTQIDTQFSKTSTKLTKLRKIKQSLLQKMFA